MANASALEAAIAPEPFEISGPADHVAPFVFASPHSGCDYTSEFLAQTRLGLAALRQLEDAYVDELFAAAPAHGAPLLRALFPRAFVDPNREPYELDPRMFLDSLPPHANTTSARVSGGLGTIARAVTSGGEIYSDKLSLAEAEWRIAEFYRPFHDALHDLLRATHRRFGLAVLIDCHSMPSVGGPLDRDRGHERADIVLGDRFGASCAEPLVEEVEVVLGDLGYRVARNVPYAGGFTTEHYGRPQDGVHALQIEINRALYMDERRVRRHEGMKRLVGDMTALIAAVTAFDLGGLLPAEPAPIETWPA
jgi:N-formylglutamate amidohydrolase